MCKFRKNLFDHIQVLKIYKNLPRKYKRQELRSNEECSHTPIEIEHVNKFTTRKALGKPRIEYITTILYTKLDINNLKTS